jgi:Glycosyltransferase family 87
MDTAMMRNDVLTTSPRLRLSLHRLAQAIALALSWIVPLVFLAWAVRLVLVEGYLFPLEKDFSGDFTRTAALGSPRWWTGQGIFYGPLFVLESRFLLQPGLLSGGDFARLDFALFGLAFVCAWLALFGPTRIRLAIAVLAMWLVHHASVEAFSNTAHLEVLELTLMCAALWFAVRGNPGLAGVGFGLAAATKTLPGLFLPYLALTRQWRMLIGAFIAAGVPFLIVCWLQQISPVEGLIALVYQGGNLTKLDTTEFEYALRSDLARSFAADGVLSEDEARLAITLQWIVAGLAGSLAAWVLYRKRLTPSTYGLGFGLISAVMLVVAPSAHIMYYIFLLPGWTAALAELIERPVSVRAGVLWAALAASFTFSGFDQPFFLSQRLVGVGRVIPENWLAWHLPSLALLLCVGLLAALLLTTAVRRSYSASSAQP